MRPIILVLLLIPTLSACAAMGSSAAKREVDAVVQDEGQRGKAVSAAAAGATSSEALATVSDGPKGQKPTP